MLKFTSLAVLGFLSVFVASPAPAGPGQDVQTVPSLNTNESFIDELSKSGDLEIEDPGSVLSFVLGSLPERVNVYPTENYYYFDFYHRGLKYAGNIRLDASDRDDGIVHFTYFRDVADQGRREMRTLALGAEDGLVVEKAGLLAYRVSFEGRSILFQLNDLSGVEPPRSSLKEGEQYIGPVFDESGVQFFLIFNPQSKVFYYVANEAASLNDQLVESGFSDRIKFGLRTKFSFFQDYNGDRLILIGVLEDNVRANNYYDGPFDQIPDNFIEGDMFRNTFLLSAPKFAFPIDRFGRTSGSTRVLIRPYVLYRTEDDLRRVDRCATRFRRVERLYYRCFDEDLAARPGRSRLP